ncbi:hypothetical protein AVEN_32232-1 [Araneus ventricosus]|uniref:Uncharacterized protein n=1 Tax=Araneus ventricosus TaxID=182803 RepID=A0A4Y2Q519_ARAVE|nr:hypothetical protein AVEN_32232-1 [Araneus ventricosus]
MWRRESRSGNYESETKLMFIPILKEVFELVFKNECSTLISRNKLRYLLFTLNWFATVPCESPSAFSVHFHKAPNTQLHWYIKSILPNSPESEQRSAPNSSDSRGSTVMQVKPS